VIDPSALHLIAPKTNTLTWAYPLSQAWLRWMIDSPARQAMFLAQACVECAEFTQEVENLNYSAQRLLQVFPSHFTQQSAADYAHQPERIANWVYAHRMGNGDEASADGWRFRGRGIFQHTGRSEYECLTDSLGLELVTNPDQLVIPQIACYAAGSYWQRKGCNAFADVRDLYGCTRAINGGTNGIMDRQAYYLRACRILGVAQLKGAAP
jgi:putative chitinase